MMSIFQVGDRVVPISKSTGRELRDSNNWKNAQARNQLFLYINNIRSDGLIVCGAEHVKQHKGDFFLPKDLIFYEADDIKNENMLHLLKSSE